MPREGTEPPSSVIGDPTYEPDPYWELVDFADSAHDIGPPGDADEAASLERFG